MENAIVRVLAGLPGKRSDLAVQGAQVPVYKPCTVMKVYAVRYLEDAAELSGTLILYDGSG
ncbi:hypothetical protein BLX41_14225 [Pseudomonas protegens]|uniref:hypothetical protein n=1 Tax=Pseudomonas protegens TaxID=380021 RepID=UPI000F4C7E23|nr:hypothetical protein [Pseudomonas protegens]ROL76519.1 hypothetical protein BLX41_14225 [Pseudomonas protegens]